MYLPETFNSKYHFGVTDSKATLAELTKVGKYSVRNDTGVASVGPGRLLSVLTMNWHENQIDQFNPTRQSWILCVHMP